LMRELKEFAEPAKAGASSRPVCRSKGVRETAPIWLGIVGLK